MCLGFMQLSMRMIKTWNRVFIIFNNKKRIVGRSTKIQFYKLSVVSSFWPVVTIKRLIWFACAVCLQMKIYGSKLSISLGSDSSNTCFSWSLVKSASSELLFRTNWLLPFWLTDVTLSICLPSAMEDVSLSFISKAETSVFWGRIARKRCKGVFVARCSNISTK